MKANCHKRIRLGGPLASIFAMLTLLSVSQADTHYVRLGGSNIAPYINWSTAATNIQYAVDAATTDGDVVLVTNGTYTLPGPATNIFGIVTNTAMIIVTNGITVRGFNGASNTFINGRATDRCFFLSHSNAVVDGFTITNGCSTNYGGGVFISSNGTVQNC